MTAKQLIRKKVHPIADVNKPAAMIRFIDSKGNESRYYSAVNDMTGDRISGFNGSPPSVNQSLKSIRKTFRAIKAKHQIVSYIGDLSLHGR